MIGIYEIHNTISDKSYIGSSKQVEKRFKQHVHALEKGTHVNIHLQRSYNKHGASAFSFLILTECSLEELFPLEELLISEIQPEYNIGSVGGGDNFTNHPDKEEIRNRMSETSKSQWTPERKEAQSARMSKEKNPNWKGGVKNTCPCGAIIGDYAETCNPCRDRGGSNNPFFGRQHSEETKAKLSAANKGRLPPNTKIVVCENVEYISLTEASRAYGITAGAMHYRVNSKAQKWALYYYKSLTTIETD